MLVTPDQNINVERSIELLRGLLRVFEFHNNPTFLTLDVIVEDLPVLSKDWEVSDRLFRCQDLNGLPRILHLVSRLQRAGVECQLWVEGMGYFRGFVKDALDYLEHCATHN